MIFFPLSVFAVMAHFLASGALAQSSNNTSLEKCSPGLQDKLPFNATGSTSFSVVNKEPWNFTLGFTDLRTNDMVAIVQSIDVFLSVPQSLVERNNTKYCMYRMRGQNKTASVQDNQSCSGVLSEECQKALKNLPDITDDECPDADVEKACGKLVVLSNTKPQEFSNSRCSDDGLPGLDLPDSYRTYLTGGGGDLEDPDTKKDSFAAYDLMVQQPIPFLLQVQLSEDGSSSSDSKLLCVAPRDIVDGSRVAEGKFPPNAGNSLDVARVSTLATAVAFLVVLVVAF